MTRARPHHCYIPAAKQPNATRARTDHPVIGHAGWLAGGVALRGIWQGGGGSSTMTTMTITSAWADPSPTFRLTSLLWAGDLPPGRPP